MGGAHAITRHLMELGPAGADLRLAGLCDEGEESEYRRGLERAGLGPVTDRGDLEARGFFVCVADLEDELIRALGFERMERLITEAGDLRSWRILQRQPAKIGRAS